VTKTTKLAPARGDRARKASGQKAEPSSLLEGRYQLRRALGRGAEGRVWLALDTSQDNARRAIKVVPASHAERLRWEWQVLSRVRHPAVAAVLDLLRVTRALPEHELAVGAVLMVTERASGEPLDRALAALGSTVPARLNAVVLTGFSIARALTAFHRVGLVHGDVKPSNILLTTAQTAQATQAAQAMQATLIDPSLAAPPASNQSISGTPGYLAPERWRGTRSFAADSFALGVTLIEALSPQSPTSAHLTATTSSRDVDLSAALRTSMSMQARVTALSSSVPSALRALLSDLVAPDSALRPTPAQAAARLADVARELSVPLPWQASAHVGAGVDELPSVEERVAALQNLPWVGPNTLREELTMRLATESVTCVVGAPGCGRSRLIREAVQAIQTDRIDRAGPVPSYLVVDELPDAPPRHDAVVHVLKAGGVDTSEARAFCVSALVDGVRVAVVLEREGDRREPNDVRVDALSRTAIGELLHHALGEENVGPSLVNEALSVSGGLAGVLVQALVADCRQREGAAGPPDLNALSSARAGAAVSGGSMQRFPEAARELACLLACAGGTLDAATVQSTLEHAKAHPEALTTAMRELLDAALATLGEDGRLRLRPDVVLPARRLLSSTQVKALAKRALTTSTDPVARPWLLHAAADASAGESWRGVVMSLRERGTPTAALRVGLDGLALLEGARGAEALSLEVARTMTLLGRYAEVVELLAGATSAEARLCVAEAERRAGHLERARTILNTLTRETDHVASMHASLARLELDAGDHAAAKRHTSKATAATGWARVRGLEVMAWLALRDQDHVGAEQAATQAIEHAREHGLVAERSRVTSVLATVELARGDTAAACAHYASALELAQRCGDVHGAALCLLNLGLTRVDLGEVGVGLVVLRDAARRLLRLGRTSDAARALYNLGNAGSLIGDDAMALSALRLAEASAASARVSSASAYARLCTAEIHARHDEHALAKQFLKALDEVEGLSDDEVCVVAARGAALWLGLGERETAKTWLARCDRTNDAALSALAHAERAQARARICLSEADAQAALVAAETCVAASHRAGTFEARLRASLLLAAVLEAVGRPGEATHALEAARQLLDRVATGLSAPERARLREVTSYRVAFRAAPASSVRTVPTVHGGGASEGDGSARWRRLAALSAQLVSEHRASRLLDRVLDAAIELASAERGFVVEQVNGELQLRAARGLTEATLSDAAAPSRTFVSRVISEGRPMASVDALQDARLDGSASVHALSLRSVIAVPLRTAEHVAGAIYLDDGLRPFAFGDEELSLLTHLAEVATFSLDALRRLEAERLATRRLAKLRRRLKRTVEAQALEISSLRGSGESTLSHPSIVGRGAAMRALLALVDRVTRSELPVLISGESGTGKELVARAIHDNGPRGRAPFVSENCSAIPETLLESALFGHVRGAFTGADRPRTGLFDAADGGTLFLDEIGEMSQAMQSRLLRVVQDGELRPLGSERARKVDVRVVAATHRDLEQMVREGTFREDLYYRLAVVNLKMPALRERAEDIPELVAHFVRKYGDPNHPQRIDRKTLAVLSQHAWPGNVRQLENEIRRALVLSDGPLRPEHLSPALTGEASVVATGSNLREHTDALERRLIQSALDQTKGNQTQAAKLLGVSRFGLQKMLKRLGLAA